MNASVSIHSDNSALELRFIRLAKTRMERMRSLEIHVVEPLGRSELEKALGQKIDRCDLWIENWRNRIYKVQLGGETVVAKQVCAGPVSEIVYQYEQLAAITRIGVPGLKMPQPLAFLESRRAFVMEFAKGRTIQSLVWSRAGEDDLGKACELAGRVLACIHKAWMKAAQPFPSSILEEDFAERADSFSSSEQSILRGALERLAPQKIAMGKIYFDYKPPNVLYQDGVLSLIDPPSELWEGLLLWDLSLFRGFMRRELWKYRLKRPLDRRRAVVDASIAAFERGYVSSLPDLQPEQAFFPLTVRILELQRVAQLITLQQEKVRLAGDKTIPAGRLGSPIGNRLSLPLLMLEKRWLVRQIERESIAAR